MDPKTFAKLDPKLRETYERVMGTAVPQKPTIVPAKPQSTSQTPPPETVDSKLAGTPPLPAAPTVVAAPEPSTLPQLPPLPEKEAVHTTIAVHTATPSHTNTEKKEVHDISGTTPAWKKILFIVLGIIFFIIYAVFWLLFFKVQLPF